MSTQVLPHELDHETMQPLPPRVQAALDDFKRRLLQLFPGEISQLVLYGSYARGEATSDSDVDVLVVVKWREEQLPDGTYLAWFGEPGWNQVIDLAVDVLLERGVHISPLVMSESRVAVGEESILRAIQREGKILQGVASNGFMISEVCNERNKYAG